MGRCQDSFGPDCQSRFLMEFPRRGGVGRSLGTSERKAGRKEKQTKPGPKPKKRNARAEAKKKGQALTEPGEDEVEESTMHADEQTRSQPTGTIELEEREEDQRLGGARCLCCNAHMDNDQYAVCMDCGGGV